MSKIVRKGLFVIAVFLFFLANTKATALQGLVRKYLDDEVAKAKFVVVTKFVSYKDLPNRKVQESVKARKEWLQVQKKWFQAQKERHPHSIAVNVPVYDSNCRLSNKGLLCEFQVLKILKQPDGSKIKSPLRMWLLSTYDDCKGPPFYYAQRPPAQDSEWIFVMMSNRKDKDGALIDVERASATPEALSDAERGPAPMNSQNYGNVRILKVPAKRTEMCVDR